MAVEVVYVVTRKGVRMMETTSEADARAYDLMLEQAEALAPLLAAACASAGVTLDERAQEEISISLAKQRDEILEALASRKGSKSDTGRKAAGRARAARGEPLQAVDDAPQATAAA